MTLSLKTYTVNTIHDKYMQSDLRTKYSDSPKIARDLLSSLHGLRVVTHD